MSKKISKLKKIALLILSIFIIFILSAYYLFFKNNIQSQKDNSEYICIPSHSNYTDVLRILKLSDAITNLYSFELLAKTIHYADHIHPGRYCIKHGMNNISLLRMLYSGKQTAVKLTFNNIRLKSELASKVSLQLEADSNAILQLLNNKEFLAQFDMTPETSLLLCLPNTYEFWWNTSAEQFIKKMAKEYNFFWNEKRRRLSQKAGLSPLQIGILASIVDQESNKKEELSRIAGVYINRFKNGMKLQADPTIKFSLKNFTIKRILKSHLTVESPYNTYMHEGLPPGPICLPNTFTIDYVLNHEKHDYFYFCAKDDLSGLHIFAKTYEQHKLNAKKYHQAISD